MCETAGSFSYTGLPLTSVALIMRNSPILSLCSPLTGAPSTSIVRAPMAAQRTLGAWCSRSPSPTRQMDWTSSGAGAGSRTQSQPCDLPSSFFLPRYQ